MMPRELRYEIFQLGSSLPISRIVNFWVRDDVSSCVRKSKTLVEKVRLMGKQTGDSRDIDKAFH